MPAMAITAEDSPGADSAAVAAVKPTSTPCRMSMPGVEKRLARYPQLYSRVGFVHEVRSLTATELRRLLQQHWHPAGVRLPAEGIADEESISSIIRVTGGSFRLLHRLLTQMARVLDINKLEKITLPVVEATRESLVIGTA